MLTNHHYRIGETTTGTEPLFRVLHASVVTMRPATVFLVLLTLTSNDVIGAIKGQHQRPFGEESKHNSHGAIKFVELWDNVEKVRRNGRRKLVNLRETYNRIATNKFKVENTDESISTAPESTIPVIKESLQSEPKIMIELPITAPLPNKCDGGPNCDTRTLIIKTIDIDYVEIEEEETELDLYYDFDVSSSTRLVSSAVIAAGIVLGVAISL